MYSDNLIPELPNTAHSCSQDGLATAWLLSERPQSVIPVPKISTLLGAAVRHSTQFLTLHFAPLLKRKVHSPESFMTVFLKWTEKRWTSLPLHSCAVTDHVIWRGQYIKNNNNQQWEYYTEQVVKLLTNVPHIQIHKFNIAVTTFATKNICSLSMVG
jgi:hypothetical protein